MKNIYFVFIVVSLFLTFAVSNLQSSDNQNVKYKTISLGDELSMTCNNLNDIAKVQWFKDGQILAGEVGEKLYFPTANLNHEGTYYAVVDGVCGITRTNDMVVKVEIPQQFGVETAVSGGDYLFQNEPNPAGEVVRLKFSLSTNSFIKLVLSDSFGNQLAVLHEGFTQAGLHNIEFNTISHNLSNGVYFYTLLTEGFKDTKSLVIIR